MISRCRNTMLIFCCFMKFIRVIVTSSQCHMSVSDCVAGYIETHGIKFCLRWSACCRLVAVNRTFTVQSARCSEWLRTDHTTSTTKYGTASCCLYNHNLCFVFSSIFAFSLTSKMIWLTDWLKSGMNDSVHLRWFTSAKISLAKSNYVSTTIQYIAHQTLPADITAVI